MEQFQHKQKASWLDAVPVPVAGVASLLLLVLLSCCVAAGAIHTFMVMTWRLSSSPSFTHRSTLLSPSWWNRTGELQTAPREKRARHENIQGCARGECEENQQISTSLILSLCVLYWRYYICELQLYYSSPHAHAIPIN